MPSGKKDATALLAEKMVQTLRDRKQRGDDARPLTLEQLARLADATAGPRTILAAVHPQRKAFSQHAMVARKDLQAPAALLEDVPRLAASPALLEFLLQTARTPSNHALTAAELKAKATSKLQKPFQDALNRQVQEESLPATVGWVLIRNSRKLFLLADLHTGRRPQEPRIEDRGSRIEDRRPAAPVDFGPAFDQVFQQLDRQMGGHNFVSLVDLRRALPLDRAAFDAQLRQLRLAGRYTLSAAEGRHGLGPTEQEAGITEDGTLLLYVSRKSP
jgi:hypothetical protein